MPFEVTARYFEPASRARPNWSYSSFGLFLGQELALCVEELARHLGSQPPYSADGVPVLPGLLVVTARSLPAKKGLASVVKRVKSKRFTPKSVQEEADNG